MANSKSIVELILQTKVEGEQSLDQLRDTVSGLIKQQEEAGKQAGDYDQQIEKLRATMDGLVRAERELIQKGRLVEKFKDQAKATSQADAKTKQLIQTARELRAELSRAGEFGPEPSGRVDKLQKQFDRASAAAQKASANFRKQKTRLGALTTAMKAAGLATGNLAHAERQLAGEARRLQGAQNRTTDAIARLTVKSDEAARSLARFGKNSRSSLSLVQRLRGEVLSLAAAYVGLFGVGREVGNVFEAVRQKEAIESRFRVAFDGDPNAALKVEEELGFVRDTADKLKISFLNLGTEYSKFISAVPEGIFTLEQQRKIFSDIATGARVMRLSQDEVAGTFKAIIQIASKGTFQMEELRGQLGDRLPGALLLFAKQMGVSTRQLDKMVEQGQVGADKLTVLGEAIENKFGGDLEKALAASTTQLDAFLLEVERLRIEIGEDSGFVDTLGESLGDLSEELRKPEFKEGLIGLAKLMGQLAQAGVWLVKNLDAVKNTLIALLGAKVIGGLIRGFFSARRAVLAFTLSLKGLSVVGIAASGPTGWIIALAAGLATIALNSRKSGPDIDRLIEKYTELGVAAEEAGKKVGEALGSGPELAIDQEIDAVIDDLGSLVVELQRLEDFKGRNPLLASVLGTDQEISRVNEALTVGRREITALREEREKLLQSQGKNIQAEPANLGLNEKQLEELEKAIAKANKEINKFEVVTLQQKLAQVDKAFAELLETARSADDPAARAAQEAKVLEAIAAQKRSITLGEEKKLLKEFERLENAAAKQSADTLQGRLDNIRQKYERTIGELRALGLSAQADRLESILATELAGEIDQVKIKLRETLTQIRAEDGNDLEARLQLIRDKYTKLIADLNAAGDIEGVNLAGDTQKAELDAARLAHAEEEINRLQEIREARLARIQLQQEAGVLTAFDAQEQMRSTVEELDPQLQSMLDKAIAMAEAMGNTQMVENLKAMKAELVLSADSLDPVRQKVAEIQEGISRGLAGAITDWVSGIKSAGAAFRQFAREFLIQIAQMILQEQILLALQLATGTAGTGAGSQTPVSDIFTSFFHGGGVVGQGGTKGYASPLAFAGAYRYHGGGIAGLRPDETGAILKKGEEVLTEQDPRHRNNGGGGAAPRFKVVNCFDAETAAEELNNTAAGEQAFMNNVQLNRTSIKEIIDGG